VGVAAFAVAGATLAAFLVVFAAYAIVGDLFEIAGGFQHDVGGIPRLARRYRRKR